MTAKTNDKPLTKKEIDNAQAALKKFLALAAQMPNVKVIIDSYK